MGRNLKHSVAILVLIVPLTSGCLDWGLEILLGAFGVGNEPATCQENPAQSNCASGGVSQGVRDYRDSLALAHDAMVEGDLSKINEAISKDPSSAMHRARRIALLVAAGKPAPGDPNHDLYVHDMAVIAVSCVGDYGESAPWSSPQGCAQHLLLRGYEDLMDDGDLSATALANVLGEACSLDIAKHRGCPESGG